MLKRLTTEINAGVLMLAMTVIALLWANTGDSYQRVLHLQVFSTFTIKDFIDEALMGLFFLLVSIEIKQEIAVGHLSTGKQAILPVAAAFGGMLVPALIYLLFNSQTPYERGWGIPMATDIAFTLGVLQLLGKRVPAAIIVFVSALAIADDLGAVAVIAVFYGHAVDVPMLLAAVALAVGVYYQSRRKPSTWLTIVLGLLLWWIIRSTGLHATIAGVLIGFLLPTRTRGEDPVVARLRKPVDLIVLPIFALANAGVQLAIGDADTLSVFWGTALGLLVGKPLGIVLFSWLALQAKLGEMARGVRWSHVLGAAVLCGIGFTMSLFITELALGETSAFGPAKLAVLCGSFAAGLLGYGYFVLTARRHPIA